MINLDNFDGHLVLYCKNNYYVPNIDFLTGLRRIWAIRCGYDYKDGNTSVDRYIADHLYDVLKLTDFHPSLQELLHNYIVNNYYDDGKTAIENIIMFYRSRISMLIIREKVNTYWKPLIHLPKTQRRVFKRIVRGNGRYNDYKLIN
jgi:hypothetical protein